MDIKAHQFDPDKKYDEEFGAWAHGPGSFFAATPNRGHVPVGKTDWILNFTWPGNQNEGERFERLVVSDALYQAFFASHVNTSELRRELSQRARIEGGTGQPMPSMTPLSAAQDRPAPEPAPLSSPPVEEAYPAEAQEVPVAEEEPEKPFAESREVLPPAKEPEPPEIDDSPAKGKSRKAHGMAGKDSKSGK